MRLRCVLLVVIGMTISALPVHALTIDAENFTIGEWCGVKFTSWEFDITSELPDAQMHMGFLKPSFGVGSLVNSLSRQFFVTNGESTFSTKLDSNLLGLGILRVVYAALGEYSVTDARLMSPDVVATRSPEQPVPEPATFLLLGFGLLSIGVLKRYNQ